MKTTSVHSSLTMPQRLRAMVFAFGRDDQPELDRLSASAADGNFIVGKVRHHFSTLRHLAVLHNNLLLDPCSEWLFGQIFSPEETRSLSAAESKAIDVVLTRSLEEVASVEAAFTRRITAAGISSPDWQAFRERFLGEGAKYLVQEFLAKATGREDPDLVAQYHDAIEGYLFKDPA